MVVVLSLIGIIASFTVSEDLEAFSRVLARTDVDRVVGALVEARGEAIHGVCSDDSCDFPPAHGVMIRDHEVVVFGGPSYEGRAQDADELFPLEGITQVTGMREILFTPSTVEAISTQNMLFSNSAGAEWKISIDYSGAIRSSLQSSAVGIAE